jgi:hypothetical protein
MSETLLPMKAPFDRPAKEGVPTALYRHFDGEGRLLYVGISLSPTYRLSQHRVSSSWFVRISRISVEWFHNRDTALEAERRAIKAEKPEYNIVHKVNAKQQRLAELAEESCAELTMKVTRFDASHGFKGAAHLAGIRPAKMAAALFHGDLPYYLDGDNVVITGWSLIAFIEALQAGQIQLRGDVDGADGKPIHSSLRRLAAALRAQNQPGKQVPL